MESLHSLLRRQLRQNLGASEPPPPDLARLIEAVDRAYHQFDDDRRMLEIRVRQFAHPRAHARRPPPRTVHQVGNVRVVQDDGRELRVTSTLVMVESRQERQLSQ